MHTNGCLPTRHTSRSAIAYALARSLVLVVTFTGAVPAQARAEFRLERLSGSEMHVEPGASATYRLRISNVGDQVGTAHLGSNPVYPPGEDTNYTLVSTGPSVCGAFTSEYAYFNGERTVFLAGPIAPGDSVECSMLVSRGVDSWSDRFLLWAVRDDRGEYVNPTDAALLGTLTDVSISARSFTFAIDNGGFAHADVRLEVRNGGGVPVVGQIAGYCEDHGFRPFLTDGGEGGCSNSELSPGCFDWGYGFQIPEIAAGATYRCRIHLKSIEPYDNQLSFPIGVGFWQTDSESHHALIDTNEVNNTSLLRLGPTGTVALPAPSLTLRSLSVLSLLIVCVAYRWIWSRRRR